MLTIPPFHIWYAKGANQSSHHIDSTSWVIFSPNNEFMDSRGIFFGHSINNIVEYEVVIELMTNASSLGIHSLVVGLDSELVIPQLTSHYSICNPVLYQKYMRVCLLEHSFVSISYEHVLREFNTLADSLANEVLYWLL